MAGYPSESGDNEDCPIVKCIKSSGNKNPVNSFYSKKSKCKKQNNNKIFLHVIVNILIYVRIPNHVISNRSKYSGDANACRCVV